MTPLMNVAKLFYSVALDATPLTCLIPRMCPASPVLWASVALRPPRPHLLLVVVMIRRNTEVARRPLVDGLVTELLREGEEL